MSGHIISCVALAVLSLGLVFGAPAPYTRPTNADCVASYVPTQNYFPQEYQIVGETDVPASSGSVVVTVATGFTVEYFPSYKIVNNTVAGEVYVLYQCGTTAPSNSLFPAGTKLFEIPLTQVAVAETVPYAYMNALGVANRAQSVSSFTVAPCGQLQADCGETFSSSALTNTTLLTDSVLPYVDGVVSSSVHNNSAFFTFSASLDPGTLNRAEWIKFMGLFFNLDEESSSYFQSIEASYNATKVAATSTKTSPVVAFTEYFSYAPTENLQISFAAYKNQYIVDAGGKTLNRSAILAEYPNVTLSGPTDLAFDWTAEGGFSSQAAAVAAFQAVMSEVDVLIDETYAPDPLQFNMSVFLDTYFFSPSSASSFPFLANNAVFREDGLISAAPDFGLDWFEGAYVRPDRVLTDFIRAIQPSLTPASYNFTWIRNIANGEVPAVEGSSSCVTFQTCSAPVTTICPFVQTCPNGTSILRPLNGTACITCAA